MVTVGFGDITPPFPGESSGVAIETIYTALVMYIGVIISCSTIGNLTNSVANMDTTSSAYNRRMDNLKKYMQYRRLPMELRAKINNYYEYLWSVTEGIEEDELLSDLPVGLRGQIKAHVMVRMMAKVDDLRGAPAHFLCALASSMQQRIFSPKEAIVRRSQMVTGIYFLCRGVASVMDDRGLEAVSRIEESGHFQEGSIFDDVKPSQKTVMATSYCEVYILQQVDYRFVSKESVEFQEAHDSLFRKYEGKKKGEKKAKKFFGADTYDSKDSQVVSGFRRHMLQGSKFRRGFNITCFAALVLYVIFIPLHFVAYFSGDEGDNTTQLYVCLAILYLVDAFFIVDMILNFRFFFFSEDGAPIMDPKRIRQKYMKSWFWPDLIAVLPLEILTPAFGFGLGRMALLRLNKVVRLAHLFDYWAHVEQLMRMSYAAKRIIILYVMLLSLSHIAACLWLLMGHIGDRLDSTCNFTDASHMNETCTTTWRRYDEHETDFTLDGYVNYPMGMADYFRALYFAIVGMSTIGYGDIVPTIAPRINIVEAWYATVLILIGGLIYPATIGGMASLMSKLGAARAKYNTLLFQIREFISRENLSKDLQNRIIKFYDYRWTRKGGIDEIRILEELPSHLRKEVSGRISKNVCDNIPFFQVVDRATVEKLVALLEPAVFLPGDIIIRCGHFGKEMFFLERGLVQVTDQARKLTYGLLHDGDYFGEGALLEDTLRIASVISLLYSDCFVLTRDAFFQGLRGVSQKQREIIMEAVKKDFEVKIVKNKAIAENLKGYDKLSTTMGFEVPDAPELSSSSWRHPDSNFRYSWDIGIMVIILWNIFAIPVRVAFLDPGQDPLSGAFIFDYILDAVLIVDLYLSHNRYAYLFEGQIMADPPEIRKNHRKGGRFLKEILASVPWDMIAIAFAGSNQIGLILSVLRLPKLIRAGAMPRYLGRLERAIEDWHFFIKTSSLRLITLAVTIMMVAHWAACLFYVFTRFASCKVTSTDTLLASSECRNLSNSIPEVFSKGEECRFSTDNLAHCITPYAECQWNGTWIKHQVESDLLPPDGGNAVWQYIRSLNWALPTLVVVVIGDVIPVTVQETM